MSNETDRAMVKAARKAVGLPAFERNCRLTGFGSRRMKAWRVPGTQESGQYDMLLRRMNDILRSVRGVTA